MENELTRRRFPTDDLSIVVAIDFGTMYSGYAFSDTGSADNITPNSDWGYEVGVTRYKTPTCVLTNNADEFVAFGYDAKKRYAEDLDDPPQYQLYDRFKMQLYQEKLLETTSQITSRNNRVLQVGPIIEMSLDYLSKHAVKFAKRKYDNEKEEKIRSRIRWVLTVPAIWSESAKMFMRRTAFKVGIIDHVNSQRLILALEPEAASIWCRQLTLNEFRDGHGLTGMLKMEQWTKYIVVDCGGGTIDVAVHQLVDEDCVREVYKATGGPWGGTTVDDNFIELLKNVLGTEIISRYKQDYPLEWLDVVVTFETKKISYKPHDKNQSLNIPILVYLGRLIKEMRGTTIERMINKANISGVSYNNGKIKLDSNVIESLFMPSISKIICHVQNLLQKPILKDIEYMFLVGGYSDCSFLQAKIKEAFSHKMRVMIPFDAGMSILRGAVLFGYKSNTIVSRIARKSYGHMQNVPFKHRKHDLMKRVIVDGIDYCTDKFICWIGRNESVANGEYRIFKCKPHDSQTTKQSITIYSSDKSEKDIRYVTDEGVDQIAVLTILVPDTNLSLSDRDININVYVGGTELYVRVEDAARDDGDTAETQIEFQAW